MKRNLLKPLDMKHKQSLQVSTFKFASFEIANTKFNISQLKANNFPRIVNNSYSALFSMQKRNLLKLLPTSSLAKTRGREAAA